MSPAEWYRKTMQALLDMDKAQRKIRPRARASAKFDRPIPPPPVRPWGRSGGPVTPLYQIFRHNPWMGPMYSGGPGVDDPRLPYEERQRRLRYIEEQFRKWYGRPGGGRPPGMLQLPGTTTPPPPPPSPTPPPPSISTIPVRW